MPNTDNKPITTPATPATGTPDRKPRTPLAYDSIERGALKLPLQDKVKLIKVLKEEAAAELKAREDQAAQAKAIVNGL